MDNKEAIRRIKDHIRVHKIGEYPHIYIAEALIMAIDALGAIEQIKWERDIAIKQLEDIGIAFGEKTDGVYLTKDEYEKLVEYKSMYEDLCK